MLISFFTEDFFTTKFADKLRGLRYLYCKMDHSAIGSMHLSFIKYKSLNRCFKQKSVITHVTVKAVSSVHRITKKCHVVWNQKFVICDVAVLVTLVDVEKSSCHDSCHLLISTNLPTDMHSCYDGGAYHNLKSLIFGTQLSYLQG